MQAHPLPWTLAGGELRDAAGARVGAGWAARPHRGSVAVTAPDGRRWIARPARLLLSEVRVDAPGGPLVLRRAPRGAGLGRFTRIISRADGAGPVLRGVAGPGGITLDLAEPAAAGPGLDRESLIIAALICGHLDGPGRLRG
ncbi:hypothetical protein [Corynebacterium sphenisci]|uniref:hypothetical protein n=1 Tax=Corynebacterium sphenisci TaxID=191493 RepID=UPI0026E0D8A3|nr:hypothetical protein [Corynebacterium sphenisci]MDO5731631.1 hypothetical protein [Corynebacterium sphenisci]